ncbi:tyrosine recombinase XerC [Deinococcus oregonensis]|uniref:Tyrosine recombinase XerC n=1 Tax=Deinococcus oregonensis TaxID=1805970 RepID=A0ABV6B2X9_9DEIO
MLRRSVTRDGTLAPPSRRTLAEQLQFWFEHEQPGWALNTAANYRRIIQVHLVPSLGEIKVQALTPEHVLTAYRAIRDAPTSHGRSKTLLRTARTALNGALSMAVKFGHLNRNPAAGVALVDNRAAKKVVTPHWNTKEAATFLEHAPATPWGRVFTFTLLMGLRRGEVLGLRWKNVQLDGETPRIYVVDNWTRTDSTYALTTLKGPGAQRWLPVSGQAAELLREIRAEHQLAETPSEHVFTSAAGTPLGPDNADRALKHLCKLLELPLITPHGLRHTYVSVQRQFGVPIERVSKQLGHAGPAITLAIYSHVFAEDLGDMTLDLSRLKRAVAESEPGEEKWGQAGSICHTKADE